MKPKKLRILTRQNLQFYQLIYKAYPQSSQNFLILWTSFLAAMLLQILSASKKRGRLWIIQCFLYLIIIQLKLISDRWQEGGEWEFMLNSICHLKYLNNTLLLLREFLNHYLLKSVFLTQKKLLSVIYTVRVLRFLVSISHSNLHNFLKFSQTLWQNWETTTSMFLSMATLILTFWN